LVRARIAVGVASRSEGAGGEGAASHLNERERAGNVRFVAR